MDNRIIMGDLNGKSLVWNNTTSDRHCELIDDMLANNRLIIHNDGQPTHEGSKRYRFTLYISRHSDPGEEPTNLYAPTISLS